MDKKVTIIGVCGGTASGKTTVVNRIKRNFDNDIAVLAHDDYYKAHDNLTYEERSELNYDHPNAFDTELMIQHIKDLKAGKSIERPVYDYTIHNRSDEVVIVQPKSVIVVEGIMILENKELRDLMDIKIFIQTDSDERVIRRIQRDVMERDRSLESVISQYRETVKPMHDIFVEPNKKHADIIVPYGGNNKIAIRMIMESIKTYLQESK